MGTQPYVVRQGDYLTAVAHRHDTTVDEIWGLPENAKLVANRPNPEILAPGDLLYLPSPNPRWQSLTVGATNVLNASVPVVTLRVVLVDAEGSPLAGKAVTTTPTLGVDPLSTDGAGLLELQVPILYKVVTVVVTETQQHFALRVGTLDPHDADTGVLSRLRHMGHVGEELNFVGMRPHLRNLDAQGLSLSAAVRSFQAGRGDEPTGDIDDQLRADIRDAHGC
jgi:hypothetical protein